jgi:hypothetical protein
VTADVHKLAPAAEPLALRLSEGLGPLLPCPLCGQSNGYTLHDGNTYRWWWVRCAACGSDLAECSSDRRTSMSQPLPLRWPSADEAWNEQGRHAESLRTSAAVATEIAAQYGADRDMLRDALAALVTAAEVGPVDGDLWHRLEDARQALAQTGGTDAAKPPIARVGRPRAQHVDAVMRAVYSMLRSAPNFDGSIGDVERAVWAALDAERDAWWRDRLDKAKEPT